MNKIRTALFSIIVFIFFNSVSFASEQYSKVYIFGDSLSDNGNLSSIVGPLPNPPYFENRISNGPVMVEVLASLLGTKALPSFYLTGPEAGTNYAVAGAKAFGTELIDLDSQVNLFLANHGGIAAKDNLYILFIGGNDIRNARDNPVDVANDLIQSALTSELDNIKKLIAAGAEHFMILNAPDIGKIPESSLLAALTGDTSIVKRASRYSHTFNKKLFHRIDKLKKKYHLDVTKINIEKIFSKVLAKGRKFNFTNTTDACFSSINQSFNSGCDFGNNFDSYVFFDEIHPSAHMHSVIANFIFKRLDD